MTDAEALHVNVRECWVAADDMRLSAQCPGWRPGVLLYAVVVETILVHPTRWRRGICKRYIQSLVADPRFELVVVEAVQNAHLYEALFRWDWVCDPRVSDFYWPKSDAARAACARLEAELEDRERERRSRSFAYYPYR